MARWRVDARVLGLVVVLVAAVAVGMPSAAAAPAQAMDASGEYTPVTPARILDTRSGEGRGGVAGPLGPGVSVTVPVAGRGGVPASGVSAVVLNATVVTPTAHGFLTVWPSGQPRPLASNLNFVPGQTVPNMVTVAVGTGGAVDVFNPAGSTHLLFDVVGFYATAGGPAGSRYFPTNFPTRAFDTRSGAGGVGAAPLGPGGTLEFQFGGVGDVPSSGVRAVVMNVTVDQPTAPGYLSIYPAGVARPEVSSLNFVPGLTVANLVTVPVSESGAVRFFNALGSTHVIVDVFGWYADGGGRATFGRFVPLTPYRADDSRLRPLLTPRGGNIYGVVLGGVGSIPAGAASAVVTNVTVVQPQPGGWLTAFPNLFCQVPEISNINYETLRTTPNMVIVTMAPFAGCDALNRESMLYSISRHWLVESRADVIVDVFGYFSG